MNRRIGAYVLTGDPTWLASSLSRYYEVVDDLVVLVPSDGLSWTGRRLPVEECLRIVREIDVDSKVRVVEGLWTDVANPLAAEIAQRQQGLSSLTSSDWVLQIDNDEVLPNPESLLAALDVAEQEGLIAVDWPMRVLFREVGEATFLEVVDQSGATRYEYPGPIAVRPDAKLVDCRRAEGGYLRPTVTGDQTSIQLLQPLESGEVRRAMLGEGDAIVHNSWGRSPRSVWRKIRSSAHQFGVRGPAYFLLIWLPAPLTWRRLRNFHLWSRELWPRLERTRLSDGLLRRNEPSSRSRYLRRISSRNGARTAGRGFGS